MDHCKIAKYWLSRQMNNEYSYAVKYNLQGGENKWNTFYHNGVLFPPKYQKHNVPITYNNEKIVLDENAEEYATLYAKYLETDYIKNKVFNKNFWHDWKKILGKDHKIQSLENCNFKLIYDHILNENMKKKHISKESKEYAKKIEEKYTMAIMDGKQQKVSNYKMEPPGIFLGRGCNPKLGKLKYRLYPEDITLNLSKDAPIPKPTELNIITVSPTEIKVILDELTNHKWKHTSHDKSVEWLASWKDIITNKIKYVWLGAQSDLKTKNDMNKFDLARKLKKKIKTIREDNNINLKSDDIVTKQVATALYFIDKLALRVGNEKGEDEADTVGVTSLRVEHIKLSDNKTITLDFNGKDYVRYVNTIEVDEQVYNNLKEFINGKTKDTLLFDKINATDVNHYLQTFMKELTAKVFRTYNASNLFQKELNKISKKYDLPNSDQSTDSNENKINKLLDEFNIANAKVAILCNHQKNISKSFSDQLVKLK
jgi:DNA topoisomerase-1